jgi:carbon-monoxide dehydrogenase small subunit
MVLAAVALLDEHPDPSEAQVRDAIAGNLCRCTGYAKIVEAIMSVAGALGGESSPRPAQDSASSARSHV